MTDIAAEVPEPPAPAAHVTPTPWGTYHMTTGHEAADPPTAILSAIVPGTVHPESTEPETAHADTEDSVTTDPETDNAETEHADAADADTADAETEDAEGAQAAAEPVDAEAEAADAETEDAEGAHAAAGPVDAEAEDADAETEDAEGAQAAAEPVAAEAEDADAADETADPETAASETAHAETANHETADHETTDRDTTDPEAADTVTADTETAVHDSTSSEETLTAVGQPVTDPSAETASGMVASLPNNASSHPSRGRTTIADEVVEKVAGIAAREVPGVFDLGGDVARVVTAVRERIHLGQESAAQGVSVKLEDKAAEVDVVVVIEFGYGVYAVADAVRDKVISSVEQMLGLTVTAVNVRIDDVHIPDHESADDDQGATD